MECIIDSMCLHQPDLEELKHVLKDSLDEIFNEVDVNVVECPDLTLEPFNLAEAGLCGNEAIMQIGGVSNFFPLNIRKSWDLLDILDQLRTDPFFVLGGSVQCEKSNNELIIDFKFSRMDGFNNKSYRIINGGNWLHSKLMTNSERIKCNLLGSFFINDGIGKKVLEVSAKDHRLPSISFLEAIRNGLRQKYEHLPIGLGGVFFVKYGTIRHSIIPQEFPSNIAPRYFPLYDIAAPLVGVGSVLSFNSIVIGDQEKIPRLIKDRNFYTLSKEGRGGGYYYNDCSSDITYHAYFNPARTFFCVDVPTLPSS